MNLDKVTILEHDKVERHAKLWVPTPSSNALDILLALSEADVEHLGSFRVLDAQDFPEHSTVLVGY